MKILKVLFLFILLTGNAHTQTLSDNTGAPGVTVVKSSWRVNARDRKLEEDPLGPSNEQTERDRYRKAEEERRSGSTPIDNAPRPTVWRTPSKSRPTVVYSFEATIRNTGTKKILRVVWEYIFLNPTTQSVAGRRPFVSDVSINSGKSAKMVGYQVRVLDNAAEAKEAVRRAKQSEGKYLEQIRIRRIVYDDGTQWERPSK